MSAARWARIAVLAVALAVVAVPSWSAPAGASRHGGLRVEVRGKRLVNGSGHTLRLHGVNISGTQWQCLYGQAFDSPHNDKSIRAMVAWHINAVRIPLNEDCWLGINGAPTDVGAYHRDILRYVNRLHAHGLYAILNLHRAAPGKILTAVAEDYNMADARHAPDFWRSLASYFKHDHAALFDLYNEPNDISWKCLRSGCRVPRTSVHRAFRATGMQNLVNAVRQTGAKQPVLVAGLESASVLGRAWLHHVPHDPLHQLGASAHFYGTAPASPTNIGVVARHYPVVATEIGEQNCAHNVIDDLLPWLDHHGISYAAWAWFADDCAADPSLIKNYRGAPTKYGVGYRNHLRSRFAKP